MEFDLVLVLLFAAFFFIAGFLPVLWFLIRRDWRGAGSRDCIEQLFFARSLDERLLALAGSEAAAAFLDLSATQAVELSLALASAAKRAERRSLAGIVSIGVLKM